MLRTLVATSGLLPEMVKTSDEIALMRNSGRLLASVFEMLDGLDLAGMSTMQINDLVERYITVERRKENFGLMRTYSPPTSSVGYAKKLMGPETGPGVIDRSRPRLSSMRLAGWWPK